MQVRFRPISTWPGERTKPGARKSRHTFKAGWPNTLNLLERELEYLGARDVVIEAHLIEKEIRIDGWPRAGAYPTDPGVVISFDSKYGPLRYATDVFDHYESNVRAIALGLEALRKVDRYGITKRGEQYTGWKALPAGIALGPAGFASREAAWDFILRHGDLNATLARFDDNSTNTPSNPDAVYRAACKALHPDAGGNHEDFTRLQQAWDLVSR